MPREGEGLVGPPRPYSMIALRLGRWLIENRRGGNTLPLGSFGRLARRLLVSMQSCRLALGFVSQKITWQPIPFSGREFGRGFREVGFVSSTTARRSTSAVSGLVRRVFVSRSSSRWVRSSRIRRAIRGRLGSFGAFSGFSLQAVGFVRRVSSILPWQVARASGAGKMNQEPVSLHGSGILRM
jgi:hypothetical protein